MGVEFSPQRALLDRSSSGATSSHRRARLLMQGIGLLFFVCLNLQSAFVITVDPMAVFKSHHSLPSNNNTTFLSETTTNYFRNSEKWLKSERVSNANEDLVTKEFVQNLILNVNPLDSDGSRLILNQTLSLEGSKFRSWETITANSIINSTAKDYDEKMLKLTYRLVFLAIHEHQHRPARTEAIARKYHPQNYFIQHKIGVYDYECDPDTKYIVSDILGMGFGAAVRLGTMDPFFLGLVSNRVVLFINSIPSAPHDKLRAPWHSASCHRKDMQCMFLPMSPCVITKDELQNATVLSKGAINRFRRSGKLDDHYSKDKVVILPSGGQQKEPRGLRKILAQIVSSFYERRKLPQQPNRPTKVATPWDLDNVVLEKVRNVIRNEKFLTNRLMPIYILRPNMFARNELDRLWKKNIPNDIDPESTIGLPIRGEPFILTSFCVSTPTHCSLSLLASDKCDSESDCMAFDEYMFLLQDFAQRRTKDRNNGTETMRYYDSVVLTSEAKEIMESRFHYIDNGTLFPFRFVVNDEDSLQGSGNPHNYGQKQNTTADEVMLSTLMALKMQLLPESSLLNGCSNFHKLMNGFLKTGCGMTKLGHTTQFLKDYPNPKYRLKCAWSK